MTPSNGTAFYRKQDLDSKVADVLIAATEFATSAIERIIRQLAGDEAGLSRLAGQYVDLLYGLEVHFAFLNLGQRDRDLLVALRKARNAVSVEQNGLRQWRTAAQYHQHRLIVQDLKSRFVNLKAEVENGPLRTRLTPLQRKILDQEYLSIPITDSSSTTMFFNERVRPNSGPAEAESPIPATELAPAAPETQPNHRPRHRRLPLSDLFRDWTPD